MDSRWLIARLKEKREHWDGMHPFSSSCMELIQYGQELYGYTHGDDDLSLWVQAINQAQEYIDGKDSQYHSIKNGNVQAGQVSTNIKIDEKVARHKEQLEGERKKLIEAKFGARHQDAVRFCQENNWNVSIASASKPNAGDYVGLKTLHAQQPTAGQLSTPKSNVEKTINYESFKTLQAPQYTAGQRLSLWWSSLKCPCSSSNDEGLDDQMQIQDSDQQYRPLQ